MKRKPIFNEKLYIDNILLTHDAKNLDIELYQLVQLLSIYFYQYEGYDNKNDLAMRVNQELLLFNFDGYYYELWYKNILNICQYVIKKDLKMKDIPSEIEKLTALMKIASASLDFEKAIETAKPNLTLDQETFEQFKDARDYGFSMESYNEKQ